MANQNWMQALTADLGQAGTLFNSYTTAKSVTPLGCAVSLPPNYFTVGKKMLMEIWGAESHRVTGPDTMTFQFQLGAIAAFSSGLLVLTTTAHTLVPFYARCMVTCRTVGVTSAATLMGQWVVQGQGFQMPATAAADNAAGSGWAMGPNTSPAVGTGFDSTIANTLDFFAAQSFSGAGNGIQVHQFLVTDIN